MKDKAPKFQFLLIVLLLLAAIFLAACSGGGGSEPAADESMEEMDHDDEDMDHEHDDDVEINRIPNEGGAAISITSPADGDTFAALDQIIVDVEVENFELNMEDHWHVYVDGVSYGMVMGGNTDQALPGLHAGEYEIAVYLSIGTHEEYEDGDSVTVIVEE